MKCSNWKVFVALHLILMIYSMSGICSKMASGQMFLSVPFILFYGMVIAILGFYAVCWQQIIKRIPLTTAFANKSVTVAWGLIWGVLFFHESITLGKMLGIFLVVVGIVIYALSDKEDVHES